MLWAVGFIFVFTIGGFSGLILAVAPVDIRLQDSCYAIAHVHYVLVAGSLFALFAGFNALSSLGAFAFGLAQAYFVLFVLLPALRRQGRPARARPWEGAQGLEWDVPSPAPHHTFETPPRLNATATQVLR